MNIKPLKSNTDYQKALKRLEVIFDAAIGSLESDEADVLGLLVDEYEKMHLKQIDLVNEIGGKSRVSEILNRKRKLTVEMIRKLTIRLNLSPGLLINDYELTK